MELLVTGIPAYVRNKELRRTTTFIIDSEGKGNYLFNGELIPKLKFEIDHPVKLSKMAYKGENRDKSKGWLNDEKSY